MNKQENPFYYLNNFHQVIAWVSDRYHTLLSPEEHAFITHFVALPQASRALLVRMVMRKGDLFRTSKLRYDEIGCPRKAALPLLEHGWIDNRPLLNLEQAFGLMTRTEIAEAFRTHLPKTGARKAEQLDALRPWFPQTRCFDDWYPACEDEVYHTLINPLCDRLKLMFFGNCRQDWTEFVLSDLGIQQYEKVALTASSQAFHRRADVDMYLHLHQCRQRLEQGEEAAAVLRDVPNAMLDNGWLESRRARLLFQLAQQFERNGELPAALDIYAGCSHPGARIRAIRVMERCGQHAPALALAMTLSESDIPATEDERQQLSRILPRLRRRLEMPKIPAQPSPPPVREDLLLPHPQADFRVEEVVARHLRRDDAPVYYVENTLVTSLFGLLCWEAIFAPVAGAFFHPFHTGPADLYGPDFYRYREQQFDDCLSQLESGRYVDTIHRHFTEKWGIQSPFVVWPILTEELKNLALRCIPATHLKRWFERMLLDLRSNRSGFPDLIQFWPDERRYRMIEVKGPGDRLQDNQVRWLDYFAAHGMPVHVCHVQWEMKPNASPDAPRGAQ